MRGRVWNRASPTPPIHPLVVHVWQRLALPFLQQTALLQAVPEHMHMSHDITLHHTPASPTPPHPELTIPLGSSPEWSACPSAAGSCAQSPPPPPATATGLSRRTTTRMHTTHITSTSQTGHSQFFLTSVSLERGALPGLSCSMREETLSPATTHCTTNTGLDRLHTPTHPAFRVGGLSLFHQSHGNLKVLFFI